MSKTKEVKAFVRTLERFGYTVENSGGGHLKVRWHGVFAFMLPVSPSDHRWAKNKVSEMRQRGFPVPKGL